MAEGQIADVCIILEGSYPYVAGGISTWTHELLRSQPDLTFHLVCLLPPKGMGEMKYQLPSNVIGLTNIVLQKLPTGVPSLDKKTSEDLFRSLELPLLTLQHRASLKVLRKIMEALKRPGVPLGAEVLLESPDAWNMLVRMYLETMSESSFLNYFWTWRGTLGGFYSVLLGDLPECRIYHTLCTGYAGLYLTRAHLETGRPAIITEHGIYTNERRIEITAASWLDDARGSNLSISKPRYERDLKDYWIDSFAGYSKLAYECSTKIITLYEGNQELQLMDGADPEKMLIIPNGIDYPRYSVIERIPQDRPTIALIGRVVPIKDIKTYINACSILKAKIPNLQAYVMGPTDEDPAYYQECVLLAKHLGLDNILTFTGKVKIADYLPKIDVGVLTSISEAQPLVMLEAGAVGIPSVATDVGACREMIFGRANEYPPLGQAGDIVSLSNPEQVADAVYKLLTDKPYYDKCCIAMKKRVEAYYQVAAQGAAYKEIYEGLLQPTVALST
ncbi:MAG: GT4 family glycosyltransferase PelF [Chlamydiales bacterium]|nr:GT4 family glycosyltransferase PelF [Chlamydiales bacterium]